MQQQKKFEQFEAAIILKQILSAIAFMHDDKQIVHRDLKPENILLEQEGSIENIRLIDFGTCKPFKDLKNA